jgi:hypothetical protein
MEPEGSREITAFALGDYHKSRGMAGMVQQGMHLNGPFGRAETGPGEQTQTQGDGGAIQGKQRAFEAEGVLWGHRPTAGIERRKELLVQRCRAPCIGFIEGRTLWGRRPRGARAWATSEHTTSRRLWRPANWAKTRVPNWLHRLSTRLGRPVPCTLSNASICDPGTNWSTWVRAVLSWAMASSLFTEVLAGQQ